jgi:chromosome segregation ATPase
MNERAVSQLDQVRKASHASAAGAQVDISRRALSDAETELHASGTRLSSLQSALEGAEQRIRDVDAEQAPIREAVEGGSARRSSASWSARARPAPP